MGVPNEILMQIFDHLDSKSLIMAGSVCKRWRSIVQMVHDKAWKSVTKAVQLKPKLIGPKFKKIGWVENEHMLHDKAWKRKANQFKPKLIGPKFKKVGKVENEHTWNICECINIARDFVFYDDIELLEADLKELEKFTKPKKPKRKQLIIYKIRKLDEAETFNRLFAAGILIFLDNLFSVDFIGLDWSWSILNKTNRLIRAITCNNGYRKKISHSLLCYSLPDSYTPN